MTTRWYCPVPVGPSLLPTTGVPVAVAPTNVAPVTVAATTVAQGTGLRAARSGADRADRVENPFLGAAAAAALKAAPFAHISTTRPSPPLRGPR